MTRKANKAPSNFSRVKRAYSEDMLARICELPELSFGQAFQMDKTMVQQAAPADFYFFKDNGSNILAVAHLDTVMDANRRKARFVDTENGPVVFSGALDDRLGAYIILDMLPRLGVKVDVLLTVGEEWGMSTALFYESEKAYDWIIEFDRGGTDVVMYEYDSVEMRELVRASGASVGMGSFTDICYLEQLECKGFNWGVGYQDYHGPRSHAFLNDTFTMVGYFLAFYKENKDNYFPHYGTEAQAADYGDNSKYKDAYSKSDWQWDNEQYLTTGEGYAHGGGNFRYSGESTKTYESYDEYIERKYPKSYGLGTELDIS